MISNNISALVHVIMTGKNISSDIENCQFKM